MRRGYTLLEVTVASALLLALGSVVLLITRGASQTAFTNQDAGALESQLSLARGALKEALGGAPLLGVRALSGDYVQLVYAISQVEPAPPADPMGFPTSREFRAAALAGFTDSPGRLGAFSNGMGHVNLVSYSRSGGTFSLGGGCQVGVEYSPKTAFFSAGTVEVATGEAVLRHYPGTQGIERDTLYLRRNGEGWRPLLEGARSTTLALLYQGTGGRSLRAPVDTERPWERSPTDFPGALYPKPSFREGAEVYRLTGLALYAEARRGETTRRLEAVVPLSFYPGHRPDLVTECAPGKPPVGEFVLSVVAPAGTRGPGGENTVVRVEGPDPTLNGRELPPGEYRFQVQVGRYTVTYLDGRTRTLESGFQAQVMGLVDPDRPERGYAIEERSRERGFTVASFAPTYAKAVMEEVPGLLRVRSVNFFVAFPLQFQVLPLTILPAAPPVPFFTPQGERVVLGWEFLGGCWA